MNDIVNVKTYTDIPIDKSQILRYAQCFEPNTQVENLVSKCLEEINLTYKVCYRKFAIKHARNSLDLSFCTTESKALQKLFENCDSIVLFAATVGIDIDRLIIKNSKTDPAKALIFQAIGTERVEGLCDVFEADLKREFGYSLTPRFSPGYSDVSLEMQADVFKALDCFKNIGITLNDSLLMTPTKSVTAILGVQR